MIASREDVVARDFDQACQLSERRAFVVIDVAKAQVNTVPLVIKLWMPGSCLLDKSGNVFHLFFIFGCEAFETIGIVDKTGLCFLSHVVDDFSEDWLGRREQLSMIARAAIVPIAERFPFVSVSAGTKHITLGC